MKNKTSNNNPDSAWCDPAELFRTLGASVYGYAMRVLGKAVEAEEVLGETFLRICKSKEQYSGRGSLRAWVFSIAHRLCMDALRDRAKSAKSAKPVSLPEQLASADPPPTVPIEKQERQAIITEAIERLSAEQKEVVMLKIYGGLTFRQISQTLGIPLNTALGRMQQGLKRLGRDPNLAKMGRTENGL